MSALVSAESSEDLTYFEIISRIESIFAAILFLKKR
jgi:hypothetical protein